MLESKRKAIIFLVLAFLLAVGAGIVYLQKVSAINSELGGMTEVYVANSDIHSRALLQPSDVSVTSIPNRYVSDSHIVDVEELQNKVSLVPLSEGDLITRNILKEFAEIEDQNNRLITVMAGNNVVYDQELDAMDRVDIIVSDKFDDENKTAVFMNDVLVSRVASSGGEFQGVQLEMSLVEAEKFIHRQNYADQIRIIRSHIGQSNEIQVDPADDIEEELNETDEEPLEEEVEEQEESEEDQPDNEGDDENEDSENEDDDEEDE